MALSKDQCDCCGTRVGEENLRVCSSQCGAISFAYCTVCFREGAEPWGAVIARSVGLGLSFDNCAPEWKDFVLQMCEYHEKDPDKFWDEVREVEEGWEKAVRAAIERDRNAGKDDGT